MDDPDKIINEVNHIGRSNSSDLNFSSHSIKNEEIIIYNKLNANKDKLVALELAHLGSTINNFNNPNINISINNNIQNNLPEDNNKSVFSNLSQIKSELGDFEFSSNAINKASTPTNINTYLAKFGGSEMEKNQGVGYHN